MPGIAAALGQALDRPDPVLRAAGHDLASGHTRAAATQPHLAFHRSLRSTGTAAAS